jgi:hypothetical protein
MRKFNSFKCALSISVGATVGYAIGRRSGEKEVYDRVMAMFDKKIKELS